MRFSEVWFGALLGLFICSEALQAGNTSPPKPSQIQTTVNRKALLQSACAAAVPLLTAVTGAQSALADTAARESFDRVSTQVPASGKGNNPNLPNVDAPFIDLPNGVKYKEFKAGTGSEQVSFLFESSLSHLQTCVRTLG